MSRVLGIFGAFELLGISVGLEQFFFSEFLVLARALPVTEFFQLLRLLVTLFFFADELMRPVSQKGLKLS